MIGRSLRRALRGVAPLALGVGLATCQIGELVSPEPPGTLAVTPGGARDSAAVGSRPVRVQKIALASTGPGSIAWTAARVRGSAWLALSAGAGSTPDTLILSLDPAGLFVGEYHDTVRLTPADGTTDPTDVAVTFAVQPCPERTLTVGLTVTDSLVPADCEAPHRADRLAKLYRFTAATAADSVTVVLRSTAFDPYVLVDSATAGGVPPLAESDRCGADAAAACVRYVLLPRAGNFFVEVTSAGTGAGTGAFTLEVQAPRAPAAPTGPAQFAGDSVTPVAVGATIGNPAFVARAATSDPDLADSVALEVEVQPVGTAFGDTATATGTPVPAGGAATVRIEGLADNTMFRWRVRSRDQTGRTSAWVAFGGNAADAADIGVDFSEPPARPTGIGQFRSDGTTGIATGATTNEATVVFKGTVGDPDPADQVRLEVEVRPFGTPFANVATGAGVLVANGTEASATVTGLLDGVAYHWQVRTVDQATQASDWVAFAASGQTSEDFRVVLPATRLAFATQPTGIIAGSPITPAVTVEARKASGVVDTAFAGTINVVIAPGTGTSGAVLGGTVSVAAVRGVATFTNLSVDVAGTGYRLLASAAGLSSATSIAFAVSASGAAQLSFTGQPGDAVAGSTILPPVLVTVQDANGNTVTSSTADITVALDANPAGGALAGTLTVPAVNGVASFDDLRIETAGAGYTLAATSDGLTGATSGSFEVTPDAPSALAFVVQPGNTVAGQAIAPAVEVAVQDAFGNVVTSSTAAVTIAIGTNPAGGTLSGTTTVNAASGIATFSDLSIDAVGEGYILTVSGGGLTDAASAAFDVQVGSGRVLAFVVQPTDTVVGTTITPAVQVAIQDELGNTVEDNATVVSLFLGNPRGATLGGTTMVTAVNGVATFANLSVNQAAGDYTLVATGASLISATSVPFSILPAATATAVESSLNPSTVGQTVTFTATVTSGFGTPTGSVQFKVGGANIETPVTLNGAGVAQISTSGLAVGTWVVTAEYSGATNYAPGVGTLSPDQIVAPAATTTTVTSSKAATVFGDTVIFTATVASAVGPPTGSVQFKADGANLGGAVALDGGGVAQARTPGLAVGTWVISAEYLGSSNFGPSVDTLDGGHVVNRASTTAAITGREPDSSAVGDSVTVSFIVAVTSPGAGLVTGNVIVSDGAGTSCSGTVAAGNCRLAFATWGTKALTATYQGDVNFLPSPASSPVSHTVSAATTTTAVASSANPSVFGQGVTFTATVASTGGTPTGTVQFTVDGVNLGTPVTLTDGEATSESVDTLAVATHTVTTTYTPGDGNFLTSPGTLAGGQVVNQAATTTTITSDIPDPSSAGASVTVAYTVTANAPGAGTPAGNVTVTDGFGASCTATVADGTCSITLLTAGPVTLTATYAGDANFVTSAGTASHEVGPAATVTTVTSSQNPSVINQSVTFTATVTSGIGTPTGTVRFRVNGGDIGAMPNRQLVDGVATSQVFTPTAVGTYTVTAAYTPDSTNFAASLDTLDGGQVVRIPTTTTLASDANPSVFGQNVTFTATVTGGTDTPTGSVQFKADGVNLGGAVALSSGVATTSTSSLAAGTRAITAEYAGTATLAPSADTLEQVVTSTGIATTIEAVTSLAVTGTAGGSAAPSPTVLVNDGFGNPVPDVPVTFTPSAGTLADSSLLTDANGQVSVTWTLGPVAGTQTLQAASAGLAGSPVTFTATVSPGAADAAQTTAAVPAGIAGDSTVVVITVRDANGNKVPGEAGNLAVTVTGANAGATMATIAQAADTTYTTSYTPTASGADTLAITLGGVGISGSPYESIVSAGAVSSTASTISASPTTGVTADGVATSTITVTVRDSLNNPIAGASVALVASGTGNTLTPPASPTNASGQTTATLSSTVAETKAVTATVNGTVAVAGNATVTFVPGPAASLSVTGIADPLTAGVASSVAVTARDAFDNVATGYTGTVGFTTSDAGAVTLPGNYTFVAGDNGAHTFPDGVTLVTAGEQSVTVTDQAAPALTGAQAEITVQAAAGSPAQTTASVPAGVAGSPTNIVITVVDAFGNKVTGAAAQLAGDVTGANPQTLDQPVEQTNDTTYTTSYTPTLPGVDAVSITLGGIDISGSPYASTVAVGAAASVTVVEGDNQIGLLSKAVNIPPAVLVEDAVGNPVPGADVTFTVTGGSGSATGTSVVTDASGIARAGSWTLGGSAGPNALQAAITGDDVTFAATGQAAAYDVEVRYFGPLPSASQQAAFTSAAQRWEGLVFGDLTNIPINIPADWCGVTGVPALAETIDDLVIYAQIDSIDGPGQILGQAGPCLIRSAGGLPVLGIMQFDSADVAQLQADGQFELVILHEMGHVIGLGTLWNSPPFALLANPCPAGGTCNTDPHFTGTRGLAAFDAVGGTAYGAGDKVPVEDTGGAGTRNGHWRDDVFANELMTGFLSGGSNPLSIVSVGSFWDMSYLVNYADADTFAWSASPPAFLRGGINVGEDILRMPIGVVGPSGQVERVIQPSP